MLPAEVWGPQYYARLRGLAKRHRTEIGARLIPTSKASGDGPSLSGQELVDLVHYQIGALDGIARAHGTRVTYVKPHGALFAPCWLIP